MASLLETGALFDTSDPSQYGRTVPVTVVRSISRR
jgi:hypothetical protein